MLLSAKNQEILSLSAILWNDNNFKSENYFDNIVGFVGQSEGSSKSWCFMFLLKGAIPLFTVSWAGYVVRMFEEMGVYRVLLRKLGGKRPLGRPRLRWVDNIRMDLQEVGWGYMDWIGLAQDRDSWRTLVSAVINLRVLWNAGNFLTRCKQCSFWRRSSIIKVQLNNTIPCWPEDGRLTAETCSLI